MKMRAWEKLTKHEKPRYTGFFTLDLSPVLENKQINKQECRSDTIQSSKSLRQMHSPQAHTWCLMQSINQKGVLKWAA
jgi:hypothetical protein